MNGDKCGDCVHFSDCFNTSSNIVKKEITAAEVSKCEKIPACPKFKQKGSEANQPKERS